MEYRSIGVSGYYPETTTPVLQYSITPLLHYSITPILHYSNTPILQYSNTPEKLEQNSQFKGLLRLEDREPLNHPA
jgi:hypothetical protein